MRAAFFAVAALGLAGAAFGGESSLRVIREDPRPTAGVRGARGDLWPSCWSDDGRLYAANGDGPGFDWTRKLHEIAVHQILGRPPLVTGWFLSADDQIAPLFRDPATHNRKPAGMLCSRGDLYVAVREVEQGCRCARDASISVSHDKGRTWKNSGPMFRDGVFTTIFFLDRGKDRGRTAEGFVYAYGLDFRWSSRHDLFLARIPRDRVTDRSAWRFYSGADAKGRPRFVADIRARLPVLHDGRVLYRGKYSAGPIAQGSVVYIPAKNRYLYSSWTELSHEFYEAPTPWGPWKLAHHEDFGPYPWSEARFGGYGTTTPSKFISADGRTLWLQSNCFGKGHGCRDYFLSLRRLRLR